MRAGNGKGFAISGFVARRILAAAYFAAFLSLAAQAEGLFGCDGVFPPKASGWLATLPEFVPPGLALTAVALSGAALAGLVLLAAAPVEQHPAFAFGALWLVFCLCTSLARAPTYPSFEDRLLLDAGLAAILFGDDPGRLLAAWLLFRVTFTAAAARLTGECDAWRELTAIGDAYQLHPFVLPLCWPLWFLPVGILKAMTGLKLYVELLLAPFVLLPWRGLASVAVLVQIFVLVVEATIANKGSTSLVLVAIAFSLLDDSWHCAIWSEELLWTWGCRVPLQEAHVEKTGHEHGQEKEDTDDDDEGEEVEEKHEERVDSAAEGDEEHVATPRATSMWAALAYLVGYLVCFGYVMQVGEALPRIGSGPMAAIAAAATIVAACAAVRNGSAAGGRHRFVAVAGLVVWTASLLHLATDLQMPSRLPAGLRGLANTLEALHVAHSMEADFDVCPHEEGRADLVLQGAAVPVGADSHGDGLADVAWIDLSSRFLPNSAEDRRPVLLQPYFPRLDHEFWKLAQRTPATLAKSLPKWVMRLMRYVCLREGAAATLSAGPWAGASAALHGGADGPYAKASTPLLGVRVVWRRHTLVQDKHSNKWWNTTAAQVLAQFSAEDLEKYIPKPGSAGGRRCVHAGAWAEVPVAEAALALLGGALLWKLISQGPGR